MIKFESKLKQLKQIIVDNNQAVLDEVDSLYAELDLLRTTEENNTNDIQNLKDKLNTERKQLEEKSKEMDSFKNVSLIKMMNKQVDEKDCKIRSLEKQYKILESRYKELDSKFKKLNEQGDTRETILSDTVSECSNVSHASNDKFNTVADIPETLTPETMRTEIANDIQATNTITDMTDEIIEEDSEFEEFEADIDNKVYFFTKTSNGELLFYKKLKSGKFSKKASGTFTEIDGEIDTTFY